MSKTVLSNPTKISELLTTLSELTAEPGQSIDHRAVKEMQETYEQYDQIDFKNMDWKQLRESAPKDGLSIGARIWPNVHLNFDNCDFGEGPIAFHIVHPKGVSFKGARFGNGDVIFDKCQFADADFTNATFEGPGRISFISARFNGDTKLCFAKVEERELLIERDWRDNNEGGSYIRGSYFVLTVNEGSFKKVSFRGTSIITEELVIDLSNNISSCFDFSHTNPGKGKLSLALGGFQRHEETEIRFSDVNFQKNDGNFEFSVTKMPSAQVSFEGTKFSENAHSQITLGELGPGEIRFANALFPSNFDLTQIPGTRWRANFSFRGTTFAGSARFENLRFGPVPDFRGTEFKKHASLTGIGFGVGMNWHARRGEKGRESKLQRLKELAELNKDHQLALLCHAGEMEYQYFRRGCSNWGADTLNWLFQLFSDYGQSLLRPLIGLFLTWLLPFIYYSTKFEALASPKLFSAAWLLPILPVSGEIRSINYGKVCSQDCSSLFFIAGVQGLFSFLFLFLVGLAFRNRFRI